MGSVTKIPSYFLPIGAFLAMLAVALGAMGAHLLKDLIDEHAMAVYKTAVDYQMYHALAMIMSVLALPQCPREKYLVRASWLFFIGIILFSGSLFLLSIWQIKQVGFITPIGGLCFIIAWCLFAFSFIPKNYE